MNTTLRAMWLAIIVLAAVVAALLASAALHLAGAGPVAVLTGGGSTFITMVCLGITVFYFLDT
jgi:hypothetical protein